MVEAWGLFRSAICFRSILSRQNGLNRHMEQFIVFYPFCSYPLMRLSDFPRFTNSWRPIIDAHGFPWVPMGTHGFPWFPWGPHGSPWGPHGVPMGPHGSHGPHGSPWASMENPRMSEIMDFNETHYSVRRNVGSTGSISVRNMFPLHPVTSKRPESPYGATKKNDRKSSSSVFRPKTIFCSIWRFRRF